MGQLGLHQDSYVTKRLFESALPGSEIHLATGYFNLTQEYINTMIHHSSATYNILMAHPTVRRKHLLELSQLSFFNFEFAFPQKVLQNF